jgi:hypothetical protein
MAGVGLWVQGCGIGCPGCCSRDTWDPEAGAELAIDDVLAWIARQPVDEIDGFTISGGEPFDQPHALAELADALRGLGGERDLLVYSGYPWRTLQRDHADLVARFDAIVSEPYVHTRPGAPLRRVRQPDPAPPHPARAGAPPRSRRGRTRRIRQTPANRLGRPASVDDRHPRAWRPRNSTNPARRTRSRDPRRKLARLKERHGRIR